LSYSDLHGGQEENEDAVLRYDNFNLFKPTLNTWEEDGTLVPMIIEHVEQKPGEQRLQRDTLINDGLPTPDITPDGLKQDPFNTAAPLAPEEDQQQEPQVVVRPRDPHSKPQTIVLTGELKLFGAIPAKVEIYREVSSLQPWTEIVRPILPGGKSTFCLGSLVPSLMGGPLDSIALENPRFCYAPELSEWTHKSAGLHFETDVLFSGTLQPVSDALRDFFGQEKQAIHFSAYLGSHRDWDDPIAIGHVALEGSLENINVKVFDGLLEFTRIGVEVIASCETDWARGGSKTWSFGYGFNGSVNIAVPGSIVPLQADYRIMKVSDTYGLMLALHDEEWTNVFGVQGLSLTNVTFLGSLTQLKSSGDVTLGIEANMLWHETTISIRGSYSSNKEYSLEAFIGGFTLQDLGKLFEQITGTTLDVFDHDIKFEEIYLKISSDGLTLAGAITINGHSSAEACISITRDGVQITGGISNISFEGIDVQNAALDVFIGSSSGKGCARATRVSVTGDVSFAGIDLKTSIFTEKGEGDSELKWAIYGEAQGDLSTSRLCPDLKGTFLDISLSGLALIATNHDTAITADFNTRGYPIKSGIQFCAVIENIPELESLMRGSVKGTILKASYSNGAFSLGLVMPAERTISFGDAVYTGPLSIDIQTGKGDLKLVLNAVLNVKVDTQRKPLAFALGLKAGLSGASAYAQMLTDWINPCDVGKQVVVRGCAMEFGIVYATFFTTGMPGEIGLAGQVNIGQKEAKVAMKLSQNPSEQLLVAHIKDLGIGDLVKFASEVAETDLPEPPEGLLHFIDLDLYLSTGTTIAQTYYPPGASLKGEMTMFGKRAKFECSVAKGIKIMATIEHFDIGPLSVKGATSPDPIVDFELTSSKQQVLIDGAVSIWGASASLHLNAAFSPAPKLDFWMELRLSELFLLKLQAKLTGKFSLKDLKSLANADFEVYGLMEQHFVQYVVKQIEQQIDSAKNAAQEGFDSVKRELEKQEMEFKAGCDAAIAKLEAARKDWHKKRDEVNGKFEEKKRNIAAEKRRLQDKVDEAERAWKQLVADARQALDNARHDATVAIREVQADIDRAQQDSDNSIRDAQNELQRTRDDFWREFGSAKRDLENARHDVENAQRRVDELDWDIDRKQREIDGASWYEVPGLSIEKASLCVAQGAATASLQVVRGIFFAAEAIVHGAGFVTAEGAIGIAQGALDVTREVKTAALYAARESLDGVNAAQNALVSAASDALHTAETASDELQVFNLAKGALDVGEQAAQGLLSTAQEAVDKLASCAELVAFDVAESAVKFAQENTSELNLACHAVNIAEGAVNVGLDLGKWLVTNAGQLLDIQKIEFSGSLQGLVGNGPPLKACIAGIVVGQQFEVWIEWSPGFNLIKFIKELFNKLWELIKSSVKSIVA
jgi:hypothetical protein